MKRKAVSLIGCLMLTAFFLTSQALRAEVVYEYDFEAGWGLWHTDNGVWGVGSPMVGPDSAYGGVQCAGTVLDGDYPANTDSRLISPSINLPAVTGDEEIRLHGFQWFSYSSYDQGQVQVSVYEDSSGTWGGWENAGNVVVNTSPWSRMGIELTGYAGERVRIAFYHTAERIGNPDESAGWYVDDITILHALPGFTGDFEAGWEDWYADRGVWQVGTPTAGPDSVHGGFGCVGTVLDGNYGANTDSRLIMPTIDLSDVGPYEEVFVTFWHWLSYSSYEAAYVQVSAYDDSTGGWSAWSTIGDPLTNSSIWSYVSRELTPYAGQRVRIAFYHTADRDWTGNPNESTGWYLDDIGFVGYTAPPPPPSTEAAYSTDTGELYIPSVLVDGATRYTVDMQHQGGGTFHITNIDPF